MAGSEQFEDGIDDGLYVPRFEVVDDPDMIIDIEQLDLALEPTRQGPIDDPEILLNTFAEVHPALEKAGLPSAFNMVYHELSSEVVAAADGRVAIPGPASRIFDHPDDVLHTTGHFADYYWRALREYVEYQKGDPEAIGRMSPAWREALAPDLMDVKPGLAFLTGMLVHIKSRDLASALNDSGVSERYHEDYTVVVGNLISDVTTKLAPDLVPGHPLLRAAVKGPVVSRIASWRETAWQNSILINQAETETESEGIKHDLDLKAMRDVRRAKFAGGAVLNVAGLTERLPFNFAAPEVA